MFGLLSGGCHCDYLLLLLCNCGILKSHLPEVGSHGSRLTVVPFSQRSKQDTWISITSYPLQLFQIMVEKLMAWMTRRYTFVQRCGIARQCFISTGFDQAAQPQVEHIRTKKNDPENMARSWQGLTPHSPNKLFQPRLVSNPSSKQCQLCRLAQPMLKIVLNQVQDHFLKYYYNHKQSLITFQWWHDKKIKIKTAERVEILAIQIKLDYKPQRVNIWLSRKICHIDGSEWCQYYRSDGVVGHLALDVKANQLADVISGIAPVQLIILNLGTGITDLVLLLIEAKMKKTDGCLNELVFGENNYHHAKFHVKTCQVTCSYIVCYSGAIPFD
ncbi:uncharacterized protein VP01_3139g2 [Puccinia sorghi]|uniref:Uncharacterized protein n=1 Tax=Puccinia sorghi TaxID=27349 RepID=A0A0L6UZ67_9BASI|nr:uncharacterized protein VP01_3139g2 [Puccinia sorghi]